MSVQIEKIIIEIDGKKIKLTLPQAKELQNILDETIGANKRNVVVYPSSPVIIERPIRPRWDYWYVTHTDTAVTYSLSTTTTDT